MVEWFAAHATEVANVACALLGAIGGLWAAFHRLRLLLKQEIREFAASKEQVAELSVKVDLVVAALLYRQASHRKASKQ